MNILIVNNTKIPVIKYGGTERVIWYLGKELAELGHNISYLVQQGSFCPFAKQVFFINNNLPIEKQIPKGFDIVHFNFNINENLLKDQKHIVTIHGNTNNFEPYNINSVFVSKNHAERHQSNSFVYNGLDFSDYANPNFNIKRNYFHFLGNAAWKEKNAKGAINIAARANKKILILGGKRLNTKMGIKFFPNTNARFKGMVNNDKKSAFLNKSEGLIFPVKWNEPFGLAIIESLYFGCPIFGSKHGSLKELVNNQVGFISNNSSEIVDALKNANSYNKKNCHEYANDTFNSKIMALNYLNKYEKILNGETLNLNNPTILKQTPRFLEFN
jgi:glycosyltransferase involved in cell wall biosynthesis